MSTRITLKMNAIDMMLAMSGGNLGAMTVCAEMLGKAPEIDPQSALQGFGPILMMDTLGIYEERIWMLYKDVCGEEVSATIAVLRGYQLGHITEGTINHAIDTNGDGLGVQLALAEVMAELPGFTPEEDDVD